MMHFNFVLAALFVAGAAAAPLNTTLPATVSTSDVVKLPAQSTLTSVTASKIPTSASDVKAATLPTNTLGEVTSQTIPSASTADLKARTISTSIVGDDATTETILSTTAAPVSTGDVKIQTVPNPTGDVPVTVSTSALPTTSLAAGTVPSSVYQNNSRAVETSVLSSVAAPSTHVDALAVETSPAALSTGTLAPGPSTLINAPAVDAASVPTSSASTPNPNTAVVKRSDSDVEAGCDEEGDVHAAVHAARGVVPALHTTVDAVRPGATAIPSLGRV
ncbi:hypothetical protein L226DRAFT_616310 [Lentinus tigrinus ALCF2SS1-7]|uniref:uncharacterized protein n=1 Tax=Lentinus tigrinus ALCF2SS1-7 TaxID=1328758 RepID=UPI001165F49D|nr:hypothetical protein L226DRAFT_616310 [Lentinus tigrinus ALCF2SS1-7]